MMSTSVTCRGLRRLSSGGRWLYAADRGCLSWRFARVSAEFGAGLSSDVSILMAALMLPSSTFEETANAITLASSALRCFLRTRVSGSSSSHSFLFRPRSNIEGDCVTSHITTNYNSLHFN